MAYTPKTSAVQKSALQVQTLHLPFTIAGSATSANVVVTAYNPDVLFINTDGTTGITIAKGALDTGEATPTYTSTSDSSGNFAVLVKVGEAIGKIVDASLVQFGHDDASYATLANTTGLSANGDKICLNILGCSAYNSATTIQATLVVSYIVS
jgi:hypothetical protein